MTAENLVDGPDCPQAEVVDICSRMIQIDSQNFGPQDARGEVEMCHYVTGLLDEIGVGVTLHESEPGRVTLVAEWRRKVPIRVVPPCCCTAIATPSPSRLPTGLITRCLARSTTTACGGGAPST